MSNTQDPIKLAPPFALFDEFGNGADDRVLEHIKSVVAALQSPAPQPSGFDAHDMATAAADGFRDGLQAAQASEPSAEVECVWNDPSKATVLVMHGHQLRNGQKLYAAPPRAVEPLTESEVYGAYLSHVGADDALPACPPDWEGFSSVVIAAFCKKNGITTTPAAKEQS